MKRQTLDPKSLTQDEPKKHHFFSIKLKWAGATGIGVLVIFAVFSVMLYQSFSNLLLHQEEQYATYALKVAHSRLSELNQTLTKDTVKTALVDDLAGLKPSSSSSAQPADLQTSLYSSTVITALSRKNIGVDVYDAAGKLLFSSRSVISSFNKAAASKSKVIKINHQSVFVTSRPIYAVKTQKLLGYVQVTDQLKDYDKAVKKLLLIFIVFGLTVALACAILSYALINLFMRPLDLINKTIKQINAKQEGDPFATARVPQSRQNDELTELVELFNQMLDQMERYIEQQQQFVEDVSHELRTPVAIIKGHLELLNRWGKDDPQVLSESIAASLQEITRMKSLVQEMLDLSRAGQVEVQFANEKTDVREVGLQVFSNFEMIHPEFNFVLDNDLKKPTFANIYRNHLEQVLIILLDNAVKYSTNRKEVHVTLSKNARSVEIAVQDFGEGISQENIKKIFNRFYRVDKARSRDKGGNGLGLAIAQRLIEGYHGTLNVESVAGQGSIFRVTLQLMAPADEAANKNNQR